MDELYTLSELAVTIAGFATLFSILKPKKKNWTHQDKVNLIRFYIMIELACIIAVFCFFPIMLNGYFEEGSMYRIASAMFCIFMTTYNIYTNKRNMKNFGFYNINGSSTVVIRFLGIFIVILAVANSLAIFPYHIRANYVLMLYYVFIVDLFFFIRLIYFTVNQKSDELPSE